MARGGFWFPPTDVRLLRVSDYSIAGNKSNYIFIPLFLATTGLTTTGTTAATAVAAGATGAMGAVGVTDALGGCELATDMGIMPPPLLLLRARP